MKISPPRRQRRLPLTPFLAAVSLAGLLFVYDLILRTSLELPVLDPTSSPPEQQAQVERRIPPNAKTSEELCKVTQQLESAVENPKKQAELLKAAPSNGSLMSQFYQDATLISALGKLFHSDDLLYVDLAAAWPEKASNTVLLDRCYGWKGLCVGADPTQVQALKEERSCQVLDNCVTDTHGASGTARLEGSMECKTLATIFDEYRIREVDILSLDVEGSKATVMGGIDFTEVTIDIIVFKLQHHLANEEGQVQEDAQRMIQMLEQQGYVPLLQLFSYRNGLPIQDCDTVMYGKSVESVFKPPDGLQRWRTQDVLFVQWKSLYLPPLLEWIRAAGCDILS